MHNSKPHFIIPSIVSMGLVLLSLSGILIRCTNKAGEEKPRVTVVAAPQRVIWACTAKGMPSPQSDMPPVTLSSLDWKPLPLPRRRFTITEDEQMLVLLSTSGVHQLIIDCTLPAVSAIRNDSPFSLSLISSEGKSTPLSIPATDSEKKAARVLCPLNRGKYAILKVVGRVVTPGQKTDNVSTLRFTLRFAFVRGATAGAHSSTSGLPRNIPYFSVTPSHTFIVLFDALRADIVSTPEKWGITLPHINEFKRNSIWFTNTTSLAPYTLASTATLWTGLNPLRHGLLSRRGQLPGHIKTIGRQFAEQGGQTLAIYANGYAARAGLDRGFAKIIKVWKDPRASHNPPQAEDVIRVFESELPTIATPSLWYLHFREPHTPYDSSECESALTRHQHGRLKDLSFRTLRNVDRGKIKPTLSDIALLKKCYASLVSRADKAFGEFLSLLKSRNLYDKSLILLLADHGEAFMEHQRLLHNSTLYQEMLAIPLFIKFPGQRSGYREDSVTNTLDVARTLRALLLNNKPPPVYPYDEGADVRRIFMGDSGEALHLLVSAGTRKAFIGARFLHYKLVMPLNNWQRPRLYDCAADPKEEQNRITERPALTALLFSYISHEYRRATHQLQQQELPPLSEHLRSLGYLE